MLLFKILSLESRIAAKSSKDRKNEILKTEKGSYLGKEEIGGSMQATGRRGKSSVLGHNLVRTVGLLL